MFALAVLIGIYSYGIFALGILHILTPINIAGFSLSFLLISALYLHDKIKISLPKFDRYSKILLALIALQLLVNLLAALGPELGFDALWYHLGLPKIWLSRHSIDFIPGPVFRYSVMPKLTETLYAAALSLSGLAAAKLIHYLFGALSLIVTFKLARKFLSLNYALLSVIVLSSNLVFAWQSGSAYVDLARTFFEILALSLFIEKKYTGSAVTLGLAISAKIVSLSSLLIFLPLLLIGKNTRNPKSVFSFLFFTLLIPLPWLLFSLINTGNPVYPLLSPMLESLPVSLNPANLWNLFIRSADPVSPLYIISAPLLFLVKFTKQSRGVREIFIYAGISVLVWFLTPGTGGGRFILPYLPALSVITVYIISRLSDRLIQKFLIFLTLTLAFVSIVYRFAANRKFLPVLMGLQTRQEFLSGYLNFSFGDYIDSDGFLTHNLSRSDKLLVAGINNLFYLPPEIDFTHISELEKPIEALARFNYLLIRRPDSNFSPPDNWSKIHENPLTRTEIYRQN